MKIYGAISLAGASNSLEAIDGTALSDQDMCFALDGAVMRTYQLDADSGLPVSYPDIIAPTSNAGTKRWIQQSADTEIDILAVYGGGSSYTHTTIAAALTALGTTNKYTATLRPGTWVIGASVDWSAYSNINLKIPPGAVLSHGAFTISPPKVKAGVYQIYSGTGLITHQRGQMIFSEWFGVLNDGSDETTNVLKAVKSINRGKLIINRGIRSDLESMVPYYPNNMCILDFSGYDFVSRGGGADNAQVKIIQTTDNEGVKDANELIVAAPYHPGVVIKSMESFYVTSLGFSAGSHEPVVGETIHGATSGKTAVVDTVSIISGAWATNDARGTITVTSPGGIWQVGENIHDPSSNVVAVVTAVNVLTTHDKQSFGFVKNDYPVWGLSSTTFTGGWTADEIAIFDYAYNASNPRVVFGIASARAGSGGSNEVGIGTTPSMGVSLTVQSQVIGDNLIRFKSQAVDKDTYFSIYAGEDPLWSLIFYAATGELYINNNTNSKGIKIGPTGTLTISTVPVYANNAAALLGGLAVGTLYRTGADPDPVCVVH